MNKCHPTLGWTLPLVMSPEGRLGSGLYWLINIKPSGEMGATYHSKRSPSIY